MTDPMHGRPLPNRPERISPELWERLSIAYFTDGVVAAHMDQWRLGRWSFEEMLVRLVLELAKGEAVAELRR